MRTALIVIIAAGIIAVALVAMFASALPTEDYDLSVDALKDEQSLFTNARVVIKNTGRLPITNVLVEGVQLDQVTVTAEPSIEIVQSYRTPWKLPGMIGS